MEEKTFQLYKNCIRFDEGNLRQTERYRKIAKEEERLRQLIIDTYGPQISPLLEEFSAAIYEEMELEAQHYFEQGIQAGQ